MRQHRMPAQNTANSHFSEFQLMIFDSTANLPERDHAIDAPEVDRSITLPQVKNFVNLNFLYEPKLTNVTGCF